MTPSGVVGKLHEICFNVHYKSFVFRDTIDGYSEKCPEVTNAFIRHRSHSDKLCTRGDSEEKGEKKKK